MATWEAPKLNFSHEALIDQIIANPAATNAELGRVFGRTAQWVCIVKNSGLFREQLALRRAAIADPVLSASLEERLDMVTNLSFGVLIEKLSQPAEKVPDGLALAAAQLGAKGKSLGGFGSKPQETPTPPAADRIERLAERLENLHRPPINREVEDARIIKDAA